MISAVSGIPFEALALGAPAGLVGTVTVEVYDPSNGDVILEPTALGITEPRPGTYRALLTVGVVGTFLVRWDAAGATAEEDLAVTAEPIPVPLPPDVPIWAPTVAEVGKVTPNYTRGGFDDDSPEEFPGEPQKTYTDSTSPTYDEVVDLIRDQVNEVIGVVADTIPEAHHGLARSTVKWGVARTIAQGKQPADTEDAAGEVRGHTARYLADLERLTAAVPRATRLA
jgi:hypothetical protein